MSSVRLLMAVHTRWQYHHVVHTCNKTAQQNPFSLSTAKDAPNPNESARTIIRLPCIFLLNLTGYEVKTLKAYLKCHLEIKDQKTESTLLAPASFSPHIKAAFLRQPGFESRPSLDPAALQFIPGELLHICNPQIMLYYNVF